MIARGGELDELVIAQLIAEIDLRAVRFSPLANVLVRMDDTITVADVRACKAGDYIGLWAHLPAGAAHPTEADPALVERLAVRGLRPGIDEIGMYVLHLDEIDDMIYALVWRARELAEHIAADDGCDAEECKLAGYLAALRAYERLCSLSVADLRRRFALLAPVATVASSTSRSELDTGDRRRGHGASRARRARSRQRGRRC